MEIIKLLFWIAIWILGWIGFLVLNKKGIDYIKKYYLTSLYFLFMSLLPVIIFWEDFSSYNFQWEFLPILLIASTFILNILMYNYIRKNYKKPEKLIKQNPLNFFLRLENKYLVSKSFNILFQQVMILILVILLKQSLSLDKIIISFAIFFGLGHLFLSFFMGKFFSIFFTIFAVLSAIIFPIIILYVPSGFIYTYIIHWIFYISIGLFFWKRNN